MRGLDLKVNEKDIRYDQDLCLTHKHDCLKPTKVAQYYFAKAVMKFGTSPGRGAKCCNQRVCIMSVRLSLCLFHHHHHHHHHHHMEFLKCYKQQRHHEDHCSTNTYQAVSVVTAAE